MYLAFKDTDISPNDAHLLVFKSFDVFPKIPKTSKDESCYLNHCRYVRGKVGMEHELDRVVMVAHPWRCRNFTFTNIVGAC